MLAKEFNALKRILGEQEKYLMAEVAKRLSRICDELGEIAATMEAEPE